MDRIEPPSNGHEPLESDGRTADAGASGIEAAGWSAAPAPASAEPVPAEEGATPPPWGVRRWQVVQPPTIPRTAGSAPAPVGVFAARDRLLASRPPVNTEPDPPSVTAELLGHPFFREAPQRPFPRVSPPPMAWRSVSTVAVLKSILPPIEPWHRSLRPPPHRPLPIEPRQEPAPRESTIAAATAAAVAAAVAAAAAPDRELPVSMTIVPSSASAEALVADIRARLPASAPVARPPTTAVAVGAWPARVEAPIVAATAEPTPVAEPALVAEPGLGRRAFWILLRVLLAAVATLILYVVLSAVLARPPEAILLPPVILLSSTGATTAGRVTSIIELLARRS